MMSARSGTGANTAERVPTTMWHSPRTDALPLLGALVIAERGVQNGDLAGKNLLQIGGHRRSEADLRDQQNRRAAFRQHRLHGREIYGGLARSRDAVQQHREKATLVDRGVNDVERRFLMPA